MSQRSDGDAHHSAPDFLIIGAQKAGTTAVHSFLGQHPGLYLPALKEPHYFSHRDGDRLGRGGPGRASRIVTDTRTYLDLFRPARPGQLTGEASPSYLYARDAAARIHAHNSAMRLVAILRQPVDRAYSNWLHTRRNGNETIDDFATALQLEDERRLAGWGPNWHYAGKGMYDEQLARYLALFPREQLHVALYDDLAADPDATVRAILAFLGLDDDVEIDTSARHNASRIPGSSLSRALVRLYRRLPGDLAHRLLPAPLRHGLRDSLLERPDPLDPGLRADLTSRVFAASIERTSYLIDRDLAAWLRS